MTAVLKREISAYLDRVDWDELIQARIEGRTPPDDSIYSTKDALSNDTSSTLDHIRLRLSEEEKSKLQKVCNLRKIIMSAIVRLIIVRYVDGCDANTQLDLSDTNPDFFGFNLPIDVDKAFKAACKQKGISKSRVLRLCLKQYLDRVEWDEGYKPLNDDLEFPATEVKDEELVGAFKFTHIVLEKASKNKIELACRGRGVRPSSLFRLMIARFIENPSQLQVDGQTESASRGRASIDFYCPGELYDLFSEVCSKKMTSAPIVLKKYLLEYLGRVDWDEVSKKRKDKPINVSSDSEFPNEEIWEEDSGGDEVVSIPLTRIQKKNLERICKLRDINLSALSRVMMGRYVVANRF